MKRRSFMPADLYSNYIRYTYKALVCLIFTYNIFSIHRNSNIKKKPQKRSSATFYRMIQSLLQDDTIIIIGRYKYYYIGRYNHYYWVIQSIY